MKFRTKKLVALLTASCMCLASPLSAAAETPEVMTEANAAREGETVETEGIQTEDVQTDELQSENIKSEELQSDDVQTEEDTSEETQRKEVQNEGTKKAADAEGVARIAEISEDQQDPAYRVAYLSDLQWKSENHTVDSEKPTQKDKSLKAEKLR